METVSGWVSREVTRWQKSRPFFFSLPAGGTAEVRWVSTDGRVRFGTAELASDWNHPESLDRWVGGVDPSRCVINGPMVVVVACVPNEVRNPDFYSPL